MGRNFDNSLFSAKATLTFASAVSHCAGSSEESVYVLGGGGVSVSLEFRTWPLKNMTFGNLFTSYK